MAELNLPKDQERLAKLWDAYETQEKELELATKKIAAMEHKIEELNRVNSVLKKVVEDRDKEIRDLELKIVTFEELESQYQPRIDELNRLYKEEKDRYSKLFAITEELEADLEKAKKENEIKDKWFERNLGMLENLKNSIIERNMQLKELEKITTVKLEKDKPRDIDALIETELKKKVGEETSSVEVKTAETVEETKSHTFKAIDLEKEQSKPPVAEPVTPSQELTASQELSSVPPPSETITSKPERDEAEKNETIYEFTKIPNIDPVMAEGIYNAGYTNMSKLKSATTEDLANIEGISPTLARKIRTNLFEMQ